MCSIPFKVEQRITQIALFRNSSIDRGATFIVCRVSEGRGYEMLKCPLSPLQRHVRQPQLAAGDFLAVFGAGYDDLPQLLALALHEGLGDDLRPTLAHGPEK